MHAPAPPLIPSEMLLLAYRSGIFPMADSRDDPEIFWVEPRERAVFPLETFSMSKSLRKAVRQDRFRVTCDIAFPDVVESCAQPRPDHPESWISHRIAASYAALHDVGRAHSVECWQDGELVGGLYGVSFDQVFCGESMFSRADNASKVALVWLVAMLRHARFKVLDCQFMTDHLASLGAVAMAQADYLTMIEGARGNAAMTLPEAYASLVSGSAAGAAGSGGEGAGSLPPGKLIAQSLTQTS
ncbi:leucyl/phenylalanyl-tRNA--protein transferase [Pontixanthobacter aestiaquae]|uniref:Leucyl/phenylalanyl-tRNA--protein transferase n=1 Tax=Pontixanthobacter aestiaquae TaxID=1509367 RepID=A0A844Z796_9SPHN|nr:leucyl/phenylalanyl-tRNA--protein transferase [Pontixanthobacter aestiaquae]MDN3646266.1 leucyl/phenylalanyl-tRNA--protein transferase [Pontixanthobacter aestiaquae]MXO82743.1 leucyl/phenylalanyl-tRNA--protein transferase [Pontixanthobacter aestiaquae]